MVFSCARSLTSGVMCHLNYVPTPVHLATMAIVSAVAACESKEAIAVLVAVGKAQRYSSQAVPGALDAGSYRCCSLRAEGSSCLV